jgi:hypothetical protein
VNIVAILGPVTGLAVTAGAAIEANPSGRAVAFSAPCGPHD